jgi:hypothetical protein
MYFFSIIRSIRKGFRVYKKENFFTRFVDNLESLLILSIEKSDVEKLKFKMRGTLFIYACINFFIFSILEKYLGSLIAIHGLVLSFIYIFAILGFLSKSAYDSIKVDLLVGLKKYTSWFLHLQLFICIGYYLFCDWYLKEYAKSFDSDWSYFTYVVGSILVIYGFYLLCCLIIHTVSYFNYTSGNLLAIGLKRFLAHCKKHRKEDPLQIMTFWTETSLTIASVLWIAVKATYLI